MTSLLGKKVTDSVTGTVGTIIGECNYLFGNPLVLMAHGEFKEDWIAPGRVSFVEAMADAGVIPNIVDNTLITDPAVLEALKSAQAKFKADKKANKVEDAVKAQIASDPAKPEPEVTGLLAVAAAAPAETVNPVTVCLETYAKISKAFITLGKAGQAAQIEAILKLHNAAHAKQIQTDPVALADVCKRAEAAVAALPKAA